MNTELCNVCGTMPCSCLETRCTTCGKPMPWADAVVMVSGHSYCLTCAIEAATNHTDEFVAPEYDDEDEESGVFVDTSTHEIKQGDLVLGAAIILF